MKILKQITSLLLILTLMASFSHCSSAQKLQEKSPVQFGEVYCESWSAGVKGGGSGLTIFIPVSDTSIQLDSVYFRGKGSKLETYPDKPLYIGRFKTEINQPTDLILSSDAKEEYVNKMPEKKENIPFKLNDNECVVSYKKGEKIEYYKISNVVEKAPLNYPSAPANKH
ncbi:hypothetical protein [Psychroserpens algicola]|uniref:hypothetical protein n=1 Tax=Psychroserpens algicola TaxID=1719034 RepID=UPI00195353B0|nr:hypothetical protein [Psychroserpens algicola]